MIDPKPTNNRGEAEVWERFNVLLPDDYIVYHNREVKGEQFDFCLLIEHLGALIVEVKGWTRDGVFVNNADSIAVSGFSDPMPSPNKQARRYRFHLLDQIKEKYHANPAVFSMVCYPFMTVEEYHDVRLDIVSEEEITIFKEDLADPDKLIAKINGRFKDGGQQYTDLTGELLLSLRQEWETVVKPTPGFGAGSDQLSVLPYSILSVYPTPVSEERLGRIVDSYFAGIKLFLFFADRSSYEMLVDKLNSRFQSRGIQPKGLDIQLGYESGLAPGKYATRAFNIEIYCLDHLAEICPQEAKVTEGFLQGIGMAELQKLADATDFNLEQYQIEHASPDTHIMVKAGAGTGKTYSMVSRIAFLCGRRAKAASNIAEDIAMITFTNDAAQNMRERLKRFFVNCFLLTSNRAFIDHIFEVDNAQISTIHSFAIELIRDGCAYAGVPNGFSIQSDKMDRKRMYAERMNRYLLEKNAVDSDFSNRIPVRMYELKDKLMELADKLLTKGVELSEIHPASMGTCENMPYFNEFIEKVLIPAETEHSDRLHAWGQVDIKEVIALLNRTFDAGYNPAIKAKYLFVDEFQDSDDAQIESVLKIQQRIGCKLFVVGDLKQSIYRFRGAKLSAFDQIQNGNTTWSEFSLTRNYRTDHRLLRAFDQVFSGMQRHALLPYDKGDQLTSRIESGLPEESLFTQVRYNSGDKKEFDAKFVELLHHQEEDLLQYMDRRKSEGKMPLSTAEKTIAILTRTNEQVNRLVKIAEKNGIHLETQSGLNLFETVPALDLYKLILALCNPASSVHLVNFIESNYASMSLHYLDYYGADEKDCVQDLRRILDEFFTIHMQMTWDEVVKMAFTEPILFVLRRLYEKLKPWRKYSEGRDEQRYYMENYEYLIELLSRQSRFHTVSINQVAEFLRVGIVAGWKQPARTSDLRAARVHFVCTTVHKSKGLEYGTVILPYAAKGMDKVPDNVVDANYTNHKLAYIVSFTAPGGKLQVANSHYSQETEIMESASEEARILYVAMTRAIRNFVWMKDIGSTQPISWQTLLEDGNGD